MRKNVLLGMLGLTVVLLFLTSCIPVAKYYVCPDGSRVLNPDKCLPVFEEEEPVVIEPEPVPVIEEEEPEPEPIQPVLSEEAQALFNKFTKVTSLQYSYVESPDILPENIYYTSRDKMKIKLKTRVRFSSEESYDTVYLDLIEETAVGYCENRDRSMCPDRDKPFKVNYNDYFVETPFDWVTKITRAELTGRSQTIENRNAVVVNFEINGEAGVMFVDSFFGVPLEINFMNKKYEFRDIVINEATNEDLEHQFGE